MEDAEESDRLLNGSSRTDVLVSPFGAPDAQNLNRANSAKERSQRALVVDHRTPASRQLTFRAVAVGLLVGTILCCSNTYFGLQSGWVTMGSLQSAILGFGIFKVLEGRCGVKGLSLAENVIIQTTAVATATMPLSAGLVGVVPAFKLLEPSIVFSTGQLILWSLALAFIGVFCAVPLRTQTIVKEKLKFPSGTATAEIIQTLHAAAPPVSQRAGQSFRQRRTQTLGTLSEGQANAGAQIRKALMQLLKEQDDLLTADVESSQAPVSLRRIGSKGLAMHSARSLLKADSIHCYPTLDSKYTSMRLKGDSGAASTDFSRAWKILLITFILAGCYSLASALYLPLKSFPVFTWIGLPAVTAWGWELAPSMGYIGQGMIMGPRTALSMLAGAITGYGILGPLAKHRGWAPGDISDWETGATGWILWVSLAIMLADSMTSLLILCVTSLRSAYHRYRLPSQTDDGDQDFGKGKLPTYMWVGGLVLAGGLCTAVIAPMLHMKFYEPIVAVVLALLVAVLAVRALGETDLTKYDLPQGLRSTTSQPYNPVSGVGKLSQIVFAVIAPKQVIANLAAGAIAEAGAQQAGDMMQDFKTAHLLGVCPQAQFIAMLIGSAVSVFVSVGAYILFNSTYEIPGPLFPAPTAEIWLDMAKLVNGGHLPARVGPFCLGGAIFGAALPLLTAWLEAQTKKLEADLDSCSEKLKLVSSIRRCLPSGIGFAVGMYVQARWTVPRVLGSIIEQSWLYFSLQSHSSYMVIVASGLVLGEGTFSIIAAAIQSIIQLS